MTRAEWVIVVASALSLTSVSACGGADDGGARATPEPEGGTESGGERRPDVELPTTAITEARAREIAIREARGAGMDPDRYRIVSVERVEEGSFRGHWHVFFEISPGPVPPGGHFGVYVDAQSGDARVMPGE
ncbi:MAG: hypothetical protein IT379_22850 [Deltaproteobacteria bacterium]|nr:hypothetical protein [Deltaproteobacteria bacterium]